MQSKFTAAETARAAVLTGVNWAAYRQMSSNARRQKTEEAINVLAVESDARFQSDVTQMLVEFLDGGGFSVTKAQLREVLAAGSFGAKQVELETLTDDACADAFDADSDELIYEQETTGDCQFAPLA